MAKDRGITTISPRDAAVIGACVLGASTAFRLAEAGVGVTILEAGRGDAGSSGMSFA
jgi:glycine/D-amino acid oxidase-like deaminating enzyme